MAHDCHSIWGSWLNPPNVPPRDLPQPPNDLWFHVNREDDDGKFTGIHLKTFGPLMGTCILDPNHAIEFFRYEPPYTYRYYGEITRDDDLGVLVARGNRTRLRGEGHEFERIDDEVWVGVKTT